MSEAEDRIKELEEKLEDSEEDLVQCQYELADAEDRIYELEDELATQHRMLEEMNIDEIKNYAKIGKQLEEEILKYNHRLTWTFSPVEVLKDLLPAKN